MIPVVPVGLLSNHREFFGDDAAARFAELAPAALGGVLAEWDLVPDGDATSGAVGWIVPVRRRDGTTAVVKIQPIDDETGGEQFALRLWNGNGAVRLLADREVPGVGMALLLERLDASRDLNTLPVPEALDVIGGLLRKLQRPLSHIGSLSAGRSPVYRNAPRPALRTVPGAEQYLLHGDAHYANVLWSGSTWLAIDPKPLIGPRGYDLLPAIHNRWDEAVATGDPARAVRRRFDQLTEILELDRAAAAAATVQRCQELLAWVATGHQHWATEPDRLIAERLQQIAPA